MLLYDEKKSQKRDKTSPACGGVFDTSHSSEEELYDAVTSVNVCVFSSPCEAMESTNYSISISAVFSKSVKEMNKSPEQMTSPMKCEGLFCIYDIFTSAV